MFVFLERVQTCKAPRWLKQKNTHEVKFHQHDLCLCFNPFVCPFQTELRLRKRWPLMSAQPFRVSGANQPSHLGVHLQYHIVGAIMCNPCALKESCFGVFFCVCVCVGPCCFSDVVRVIIPDLITTENLRHLRAAKTWSNMVKRLLFMLYFSIQRFQPKAPPLIFPSNQWHTSSRSWTISQIKTMPDDSLHACLIISAFVSFFPAIFLSCSYVSHVFVHVFPYLSHVFPIFSHPTPEIPPFPFHFLAVLGSNKWGSSWAWRSSTAPRGPWTWPSWQRVSASCSWSRRNWWDVWAALLGGWSLNEFDYIMCMYNYVYTCVYIYKCVYIYIYVCVWICINMDWYSS